MSRLILWEAEYLQSCFLTGIILILVYDILRIIRIVLPHRTFLTGLEDMLYWMAASVAVFVMLYRGNDGIIRWYAVAAAAASMLLFNFSVSRFLVPVIGRGLRMPLEFLGKLLKRIQKKVTIDVKKVGKRWFHVRKEVEKEKKQ